jgi:GTPase SAR1 family protein
MHSIIFLGPDRVGKTSLLNKTASDLKESGYLVHSLHFSEIKPEHNSPVDQFRDKLLSVPAPAPDYLLIDRFVSDTLFYEECRCQMPAINPAYSQEPESILIDFSKRVDVVILGWDWSQEVIDRHIAELRSNNPKASTYWVNAQLELRMHEHKKYYSHTEKFFKEHSLIAPWNVHKVPNPEISSNVFANCHSIPVTDR